MAERLSEISSISKYLKGEWREYPSQVSINTYDSEAMAANI